MDNYVDQLKVYIEKLEHLLTLDPKKDDREIYEVSTKLSSSIHFNTFSDNPNCDRLHEISEALNKLAFFASGSKVIEGATVFKGELINMKNKLKQEKL